MLDLSRRRFLQLASFAAASGLIVPALTPPRAPYVKPGESVNFIGLALHPEPTFTGGAFVREVLPWDGVGFPCVLTDHGNSNASMSHRFYDTDLCNFQRELPEHFWHDPARAAKYPNVHAYVREQRYGEPVTVMLDRMRRAREGYSGNFRVARPIASAVPEASSAVTVHS